MLGEHGWEAEWPEFDIQIGADTLYTDMLDQHAKSPADRFTVCRIRNGLSLEAASRELGVTVRTVSAYGSGARPIPRAVELALIGWEEEQHRKSVLCSFLSCLILAHLVSKVGYFISANAESTAGSPLVFRLIMAGASSAVAE